MNKRGVLGEMALAVSDANANIDDIRVFERDGNRYMVQLVLIVENRVHLARVIRHFRKLKSIIYIRRA